jgi:hypothetical protein
VTAFSTHEYKVRVPDAAGDVVLSPDEDSAGEITLDASRKSHVQATLNVAVADSALLTKLDPRASRRVVIDITSSSDDGSQSRLFDLGIRRADPDRASGTVELELASDEAILGDAAQLVDDVTPRTFQSSLRSVCEYVLSKVPGILRNLEPNSRALSTGTLAPYGARFSWVRSFVTTGVPAPGAPTTVVRFTSPESGSVSGRGVDSYGNPDLAAPGTSGAWLEGPRVTPGQTITISRFMRMFSTTLWVTRVRFHDGAGAWIGTTKSGTPVGPTLPNNWARPSWTGVVPAGAKYVSISTVTSGAQTVTTSSFLDITGVMTETTDRVRSWREQALEPGGPDADVTAYWPVASLVSNPSFETNTDGWAAGTNATAPARFSDTAQGEVSGAWVARWAANAAGSSYIDYQDISIRPGVSYVLSAYMYSEDAARNGRVMMRFKAGNGTILRDVYGTTTALKSAEWTRLSIIATAPPGAEKATLHLEHIATAGGQAARADGVMFHEGTELIPYFDGATVDTAAYDFAWTGPAHASNSTRTPSVERPPEALTWRAGVSGMDFLEPLLKASGLRIVCDELRRWSLRDADYRADGNQTYRYGANIETAVESLSREDDAWFDAAVYEYTWTDRDGIAQRRVDAFGLNAAPTKVLRVEVPDTPFPGPGRAEHIVRRAQSRGRTVTVSAIPTWLEQTDQPLSILLDGTPIQTGIAGSVRYDLAGDTVTVTSRTADTPAAAWILIPTGQRWIDSPAGGTWKNEVI